MSQSLQVGWGHSESAGPLGHFCSMSLTLGLRLKREKLLGGKSFSQWKLPETLAETCTVSFGIRHRTPFQIGESQQCQMSEEYQATVTLLFPPTFHWPEQDAVKANISWAGESILPLDVVGKEWR